jgi:hypothetical protein
VDRLGDSAGEWPNRVVGLLDVNVLVALLIPKHQHHNLAMARFTEEAVRQG